MLLWVKHLLLRQVWSMNKLDECGPTFVGTPFIRASVARGPRPSVGQWTNRRQVWSTVVGMPTIRASVARSPGQV